LAHVVENGVSLAVKVRIEHHVASLPTHTRGVPPLPDPALHQRRLRNGDGSDLDWVELLSSPQEDLMERFESQRLLLQDLHPGIPLVGTLASV
jgi:hypothetical protein